MNLPETAKLQEIYGETEICGARFKKSLQTILQKPINRTKQNILHLQEELRLSEIIQTITVVK